MRTSMVCFFVTVMMIWGVVSAVTPGAARADGCYLCEGGGYVAYLGDDTWEMRKKAREVGCAVSGTTSTCSNPKATVTLQKPGEKRR